MQRATPNLDNFRDGTGRQNASGQTPCNLGNFAWVEPVTSPIINVCSSYDTLIPGMAGVIAIHEMLHTLALPEGGAGQMTSPRITQLVSTNCVTN